MHRYLNFRSSIFKILLLFCAWRVALVIVLFVAIKFIPLGFSDRFLGGGPINYGVSTHLFSWANFDGEHYLSIAMFGYKHLEQAFFPVFPMLISFFSRPNLADINLSLVNSTITGLIISNSSFLLALVFLWELVRIDFSKKIAYLTIFLLVVLPFYSARKGHWFAAGVFGLIACATRVFGIFLLPALLFEAWQQKVKLSKIFWIFLCPLGLLIYMGYLKSTVGDPLAFYNYQVLVGEQHQRGIITLPQIYFRYIKMFLTTSIQNPIFQTVLLEFATG